MRGMRLAVQYTEGTIHPMHAFVCESPAIERELLLEGKPTPGGRTLLFYVEGDPAQYEAELRARDGPLTYELTPDGDDGCFVYAQAPNRESESGMLSAFERETVVVVPPVEFRADRTMHLTLVGPSADLQGVLDDLPAELGVSVLEVTSHPGVTAPTLTDRQEEALQAAWDAGYYEVPRSGDIEAVAAALDCAVSTASTLLRRAERQLVAEALGEQ
jgi:hypothetical protein